MFTSCGFKKLGYRPFYRSILSRLPSGKRVQIIGDSAGRAGNHRHSSTPRIIPTFESCESVRVLRKECLWRFCLPEGFPTSCKKLRPTSEQRATVSTSLLQKKPLFGPHLILWVFVAVWGLLCPCVAAQPPGPSGSAGLLLLRNGGILEGEVRRTVSGYQVTVSGGTILVNEAQVEAYCRDLYEAYEHRRKRLPVGDIKGHLELALWCLRFGLIPEAEAETAAAAALSPHHPMLPILERRIALCKKSVSAVQPAIYEESNPLPPNRSQAIGGILYGQTESSGGRPPFLVTPPESAIPLLPEAQQPGSAVPQAIEGGPSGPKNSSGAYPVAGAEQNSGWLVPMPSDLGPQEGNTAVRSPLTRLDKQQLEQTIRALPEGSVLRFTQTVQPILLHYCGTAACHGGNRSGEFRLIRVLGDRPPSRLITQQNLQSVLKWIDWQQPEESPLLKVPLEAHGGMRTPVFPSPAATQYQELVRWVLQLSGSLYGHPAGNTQDPWGWGGLPDVTAAAAEQSGRTQSGLSPVLSPSPFSVEPSREEVPAEMGPTSPTAAIPETSAGRSAAETDAKPIPPPWFLPWKFQLEQLPQNELPRRAEEGGRFPVPSSEPAGVSPRINPPG